MAAENQPAEQAGQEQCETTWLWNSVDFPNTDPVELLVSQCFIVDPEGRNTLQGNEPAGNSIRTDTESVARDVKVVG